AYFAEIFRGGLIAIDKGQHEAAQVLGLNRFQTMVRVIMPQMIRTALPAVANESVTMVKDTALLYAVAVPELLHFAQTAVNRDFTIVPFFMAGVIYLIMTLVITFFFKWLRRRVSYKKGGLTFPILEVEHLNKSFGDVQVLKDSAFS